MNECLRQIPIRAKDLIDFSEGSVVRSKFSGEAYVVLKHFKNGMCDVYRLNTKTTERWNACNNQHFIPADYISLGVMSLTFSYA